MNCPFCNSPIQADNFFCPTCGKKLREKPLTTGIGAQIGLYALSLLLPPLNLPWTLRYLKIPGQQRTIGLISLGLMCVSIVAAVWLSGVWFHYVQDQVNQETKQLQNLGY